MKNNSISWFLGSNSEHGFHSLYDGFCTGAGDFLRIIKGGPGTGKSSFMRAIGRAAEEHGMAVEYILCSGDPDSLDGIYIPELRLGYADGTAPHVMDPGIFALTGDYINIGAHTSTGVPLPEREALATLTSGYKSYYARAYELLGAAAAVSPSVTCAYAPDEVRAAVRSRAHGIAARELPSRRAGQSGKIKRRFLGGLTCAGRVMLTDTLAALCPKLYLLDNRLGLGFEFTGELAREAAERGVTTIVCPHWLAPERIEAVIFPELGLGFAVIDAFAKYPEEHRCLHLDRMAGGEVLRSVRPQLRDDEKLSDKLLERAGQCLAGAKALHDKLEAVYHPHVDFDALTKAVECEKRRLGL